MIILHILTSWSTLFLTMVFLRYSNALCEGPWFGKDCEKKCHCQDNRCNTDGTCQKGSKCSIDWFGPSCQFRYFAGTNKLDTQYWLTDSNVSTCNPNNKSKAVFMSFTPAFHFTWLRMQYKQRRNFTIKFNHDTVECLNKRIYAFSNTMTDVSCELSTDVYQISVYGDLVGFLCNILVSMGRNVAVRQPTNQTTTSTLRGKLLSSDKAVDDDTSILVEKCAITDHSKSSLEHQQWNMFYRRPVFLYFALLFNGNTRYIPMAGFKLQTYSNNNKILQTYAEPGTNKIEYSVFMTAKSQPVTHLSVTSARGKTNLEICEVVTYGDMACPEYKWGPYCENDCSCKKAEFCSSITGKCSLGCTARFYGPRCDQNCSGFCDNQGCHDVTGQCFQCAPGYIGKNCDVVCPNGKYGVNCSRPCSDKCLKRECLPNNGSCLSCPKKFYGHQCSQYCSERCYGNLCYATSGVCKVCKVGFYKDQCDVPCNKTCKNLSCNRETGLCGSNCPPGKHGYKCLLDCSKNCDVCDNTTCFKCSQYRYGDKCSSLCPYTCDDGICELKTGHCLSCDRGFYGDYCDKRCPTECEQLACDFKTGKCPASPSGNITPYVLASLIAWLILFLICVCLFLLKRKRGTIYIKQEKADTE